MQKTTILKISTLSLIIISIIGTNSYAIGDKSSSKKKRNLIKVVKEQTIIPTIDKDLECLDSYCISTFSPEKGKCRCSGIIKKYNSIEQKIKEIEHEIAERNRITSLTNSNVEVGKITNKTDDIYDSLKETDLVNGSTGILNSLEEGTSLLDLAAEKCEISDQDTIEDYNIEIDMDCEKYSAHLADKLDLANGLLSTAMKNQELAEENKFKQTNQLSDELCKTEYKNCIKMDCGVGFLDCPTPQLVNKAIKVCEEKLFGKCENSKKHIIKELKKEIPKYRAEERRRQEELRKQKIKNRKKKK